MATLNEMRLYAREVAGKDLSSVKGDRLAMHWLNGALARINGAHMWSWYKRTRRIFFPAAETGLLLAVTNGSRAVTLGAGEVFKAKWLSERWHFLVDDDSRASYELAEVTDPTTAKFLEGHEWPGVTTDPAGYTVARYIFPLPHHKRVITVEDSFNSTELEPMLPADFDRMRRTSPVERGQATHYTIRKGDLEVWPAASDDDRVLELTYHMAAPIYDLPASDDGDQEVDWEPKWADLLRKAIHVEASLTQGKRAPISYRVAYNEFKERLVECKQDDSNVTELSGTIETLDGNFFHQRTRVRDYPNDLPSWP